jgi:hypothetical protein
MYRIGLGRVMFRSDLALVGSALHRVGLALIGVGSIRDGIG